MFGWLFKKKLLRPDGQPVRVAKTAQLKRRQAVAAVVVRSCPHCQAPGVWSTDQNIAANWPGCYVSPRELEREREGQPVGDVCPNCKGVRPPDEDLKEIWVKEFNQ